MNRSLCSKICDYFRLRKSLKGLDQNSCMSFNGVYIIIRQYREATLEYAGIATYLINSVEFEDSELLKKLTLHHLLEKVTVSPFHVINLVERDPYYSHTDAAAINRGIFEAAVNFLYIIGDDGTSRFGRFHIESVRHELNIQKSMVKWLDYDDDYILRGANRQANIKDETTEQLLEITKEQYGYEGGRAPKYPSIRDRCTANGKYWEYFYDAKYRGLSAWQHGDISRVAVSSSFSQLMSGQKDRPLFESIGMISWAYDVIHRLLYDFASLLNRSDIIKHIEAVDTSTSQVIFPHIYKARKQYQEK